MPACTSCLHYLPSRWLTRLAYAQVWGFFALITSFIWVPLAIVASIVFGTVFFFGAAIATIRYFSKPKGLAILRKQWKTISSTTYGKKIFFQ